MRSAAEATTVSSAVLVATFANYSKRWVWVENGKSRWGWWSPEATAATSNGPSGNLSIKILLKYKDAQETNSNSQSRPNKKKRKEDEKKSQRARQMLEGFLGPPAFPDQLG